MFDFDSFLEILKADLTDVAIEFGEDLKEDILNDARAFAQKYKADLEKWARMLKEGELTPEDVKWLLQSKTDLAEMEALKQKGLAQAKLNKLKSDILDSVVGTVKKLV